MTTRTTTVVVNDTPAIPGCWIDGHWGQYGPDRMAEIASSFGRVPWEPIDDVRVCRRLAELADSRDQRCTWIFWEYFHGADDRTLEWLNDNTTNGFWSWHDGELFLVSNVCAECGRYVYDDASDPCDQCWDIL